ncbi:AraC family transcriptional regulator [Bradyrhizobium sp. CSA112]|uniref:AraC family transcriptional regulator n=1 Tax=Bradyrhizobium sp. CSA112 TaxID=2699170 RepID=UPI0023AF5F7A|nr:AraC family transcriptional regulator [Bradyrhizobium sp. CSA112]MDE5451769.1 AraC family transcriptional regulator [Bradyrhizobium sp. CSA112]
MPSPPTHQRTLRRGLLAVTELQFDKPIEQSASLGYDDAFLVSVFLKDIVDHECWYNGRPVPVETWDAGKTYVFDLSKAKELLERSNLTLAEVAALCGFSSQSHLNAALKQYAG